MLPTQLDGGRRTLSRKRRKWGEILKQFCYLSFPFQCIEKSDFSQICIDTETFGKMLFYQSSQRQNFCSILSWERVGNKKVGNSILATIRAKNRIGAWWNWEYPWNYPSPLCSKITSGISSVILYVQCSLSSETYRVKQRDKFFWLRMRDFWPLA